MTKSKGFIIFVLCTVLAVAISVVIVFILFFSNAIYGYHSVRGTPCGTMAIVGFDGRRGLVDVATGQEILPMEYRRIEVYDHWAWVLQDDDIAVINITSGEKVIPFGRYTQIECLDQRVWIIQDGLIKTEVEGLIGVIDIETGEEVIPFGQFDYIGRVRNGFAHIAYNDMWGLFDVSMGEVAIPVGEYFLVTSAGGGRAVVINAGEEALIEIETGEYIIPFGEYDGIHISPWDYNMINVRRNPRNPERGSSLINIETGEVIVPFEQDYGQIFYQHGLITIVSPCHHYKKLMNMAGDVLISFERYNNRWLIICDETVRVTIGGSRGIYNFIDGHYIIPLGIYHSFSSSHSLFDSIDYKVVATNLDEEVGLLCIESGEAIIEFGRFKDIILFENGFVAVAEEQGSRFRRETVWRIEKISELHGFEEN